MKTSNQFLFLREPVNI